MGKIISLFIDYANWIKKEKEKKRKHPLYPYPYPPDRDCSKMTKPFSIPTRTLRGTHKNPPPNEIKMKREKRQR